MRIQAPGWPPISAFNLLGSFLEFHTVRVTSCGVASSWTRMLGFFSGFLIGGAISHDSVELK